MKKRFIYSIIILLSVLSCLVSKAQSRTDSLIHIIYTSDVHFGLFKKKFRDQDSVSSFCVNNSMANVMNSLPSVSLPNDSGVGANKKIGHIEYLIITGDIANREEPPYQSATNSWREFQKVYEQALTTKDVWHKKTQILLTPGNHDAANAVGYYKQMIPPVNAVSMIGIYNYMMHPKVSKDVHTFNYYKDAVNYSRNIGGMHCLFLSLWPDSATRVWMNNDLKKVTTNTPVLIFTHVPPQGDAKLFSNPYPPFTINSTDKFENLLQEKFKDTASITRGQKNLPDSLEQNGFITFLKQHPNIKAYFHGHENWNEYYTYSGFNNDVSLPTFRVDSPLKGAVSSKDENVLSFQLISINSYTGQLTVREYLWNADSGKNPHWGAVKTIATK